MKSSWNANWYVNIRWSWSTKIAKGTAEVKVKAIYKYKKKQIKPLSKITKSYTKKWLKRTLKLKWKVKI